MPDHGVRSAWLVMVAKPGRELPPRVHALLRDTPREVVPTDRLTWSSTDGRVLLAAWQRRSPDEELRWQARPDGISLSTGRLRRRGARVDTDSWARELRHELQDKALHSLVEELTGAFNVVDLRADGHGAIACDQMGFGFIHWSEDADLVCLSSSAELAARAITPEGRQPAKDVLSVCCLVYSPFLIGDGTGYAGVRLLPEGSVVTLEPGRVPVVAGTPAPWLQTDHLADLDEAALLDRIVSEIADELEAVLRTPAEERVIDLTGGKDTRLVLAVALAAGLQDQFTFRTVGPEDLVDVRIAQELAHRFGLSYRSGFDRLRPDDAHVRGLDDFVASTNGTVSIWYAKTSAAPSATVRVTGMFGEFLRGTVPIRKSIRSVDDLAPLMTSRLRTGSLDLLDPEAVDHYDRVIAESVTDDPVGDSHPLDLLATYSIRNTARRYRGPMDGLESDHKSFPLCRPEAVRAAFALGADRRHDEVVHFEAMRRASTDLAAHPFSGSGWVERLADRLPKDRPPPDEPAAEPAGAGDPTDEPPAGKAEQLVARLHRSAQRDEQDMLDEAFSDDSNPVWQLVGRAEVLHAVEQLPTLSVKQRRQLYGAATAALWLQN